MEFYNSSKYNPDYRYSFIYPNPVQPRILCPKCGNNTYKGYTNDLEWGADPKPCPDAVSYTHLDVYKRQITYGIPISLAILSLPSLISLIITIAPICIAVSASMRPIGPAPYISNVSSGASSARAHTCAAMV